MKRTETKKTERGPKPAVIDRCVKALDRMMADVGEGQMPMTAKERKRTLRLRKGGRDVARTLAHLASKYGVDGFAPTGDTLEDIAYVERLAPLAKEAASFSALLADLLFQADGRVRGVVCHACTLLQGLAARDTRVAQDLAPVTASFSTREARRRNAAHKAASAPPSDAATNAPLSPPAKGA